MGTRTLIRWEYRRLLSYLRNVLHRPAFLVVQIVSFAIVGLVLFLLWFLIFVFPEEMRAPLYWLFVDSGLLGPNSILLAYAIASLITVQQIFKALLGCPLAEEVEAADVDIIFTAPVRANSIFIAKYARSIPRRLLFFIYAGVAFLPVIVFFSLEYGASFNLFALAIFMMFLLGEVGALATHSLYCIRKSATKPRFFSRLFRLLFYFGLVFGALILLSPVVPIGGLGLPLPIFTLAYLIVALCTNGQLAPFDPFTLNITLVFLIILYPVFLFLARHLTNAVGPELFEDLVTTTQRKGPVVGVLSRIGLSFQVAGSPFRTLLRKDIVTGLRKPGKAFYWAGIAVNYIIVLFLILLSPIIHLVLPLPGDIFVFAPTLYSLLLILITPLLAITAADPFRGEYGSLYLIRLAQITPIKVALGKFLMYLVTPVLIAIPFAFYFALILGNLNLIIVALAILPHAVVLSTAMGISMGSRYPYATQTQTQIPVSLMISYPVLSWIIIAPVAVLLLGFFAGGVALMLLASLILSAYSVGLMLILLGLAARAFKYIE